MHRGSCNCTLLLGGPGHGSPRVQECKSRDQSAIEVIIGPVCIGVPNEFRLPHGVHDAAAGASSEVLHDVLDPIDVIWAECGSKQGE